MAKFEFKLPDIGEGVSEGEIVGWLAKVGDKLAENQDMVEIMTDKATVTIGAPKAGTVVELRGGVGDTIPVGNVIIVLETSDSSSGSPREAAPAPAPIPTVITGSGSASNSMAPKASKPQLSRPASDDSGPVASAVGDIRNTLPGVELAGPSQAPAAGIVSASPLAAPATRKLARELGVDLRRVEPSGKGGRVTREDVEAAGRGGPVQVAASGSESEVPSAPAAYSEAPKATPVARGSQETRQPIRGMRKRIYENMARSKRTAAHFTYVDDCDATGLIDLRERLAPRAEAQGVKLTYLPFIVKAVVCALKRHPALNALVDDATQEIVLRGNYDIGMATSTEQGLMVPVLRDVDRLSLVDIAREIARLGAAAKAGKIAPADLGGSSFTITSLGKLGGLFATPVVNYPEVAIMGVHEIKRRPVVKGDQIVIGAEMLLSLSFDHRIIDGNVGAAFAQEIIGLLEEPERLLLEA